MKRALLYLFSVVITLTATAEELPTWRVRDIATDGDGVIWGIADVQPEQVSSSDVRRINKLATFHVKREQWEPHSSKDVPKDAQLDGIATLSNGQVVALWRSGSMQIATRHRDGVGKLWFKIDKPFNEPRLLPLSDGGLFITERGPLCLWVHAKSNEPKLYRIPEDLWHHPPTTETQRSYAMTHAIDLKNGSVWLWSYALQPEPNLWHIHGIAALSETAIQSQNNRLAGYTGAPISAIAYKTPGNICVAIAGRGVVEVQIETKQVLTYEVPDHVFNYVEKMFAEKGQLYVVTCPQPNDVAVSMSETLKNHLVVKTEYHYDKSKRTGMLWRVSGPELNPLYTGIDTEPRFGWVDRPFLADSTGLLLGANKSGLLRIPAEGKAFFWDNRQLLLNTEVEKMAMVNKHQFMAVSSDGRWTLASLKTLDTKDSPSRMVRLNARQMIVQDQRHHLWAFLTEPQKLAEWDGTEWQDREGPETKSLGAAMEFTTDTKGHAWLLPHNGEATEVLNFGTRKWQNFPSLEKAVQEKLNKGDHLKVQTNLTFSPFADELGNKAFLDIEGYVHVNQGDKWSQHDIHQIGGAEARISGELSFDKKGQLCVPLSSGHYWLQPNGKWRQEVNADTSKDRTYLPKQTVIPKGYQSGDIRSTCADRFGILWSTTYKGNLVKHLGDTTVLIKDEDKKPVIVPSAILEALIDPLGGAFLRVSERGYVYDYLHLKAVPKPQTTEAVIEKNELGTVRVKLGLSPQTWVRARLDNHQWAELTQQSVLKWESQLPGQHQIEVQRFDNELSPIGDTQTLTFEVSSASEDVITTQIKLLESSDLNTREAAAKVLKSQGPSALPALKSHLQSAQTPDTEWWLKAIIQQIEK